MADYFGRVVFRSYFVGDDSYRSYAKQHKTVSGYKGRFRVPRLVWDLDGDNGDYGTVQVVQDAHQKLKDLIRTLKARDVPASAMQVWFSGGRGFHLETPDLFGFGVQRNTPENVKASMEAVFPAVDDQPLQLNGLIRCRWSKHEKTGKFKVPYTLAEVFNYNAEQLLELASDPRTASTERKKAYQQIEAETDFEGAGTPLAPEKVEEDEPEIVASNDTGINRPSDDPTTKITCMSKVWNRGPIEGRRNQDLHEMVRAWRSQGLTSDQCVAMGWAWVRTHNQQASDPMPKSEIQSIVHKVYTHGYTPSCQRDVYQEYCDPACIFYDHKNFGPKANALSDGIEDYIDQKASGTEIVFDLETIYPGHRWTLQPGEVCTMIGDTGKGKTALFQNWIKVLTDPRRDDPLTAYVNSSEMGLSPLQDRFLQIQYDLKVNAGEDVDQVEQAVKAGWLTRERIERAFSNIHLSTEAMYVDEIYEALKEIRPDLMLIDPLEDVKVRDGGYDSVMDMTELITQLQQIGTQTGTAILIVHHINKAGMDKKRLTMQDAKGAKAVLDKSDFVLAFDVKSPTRRALRQLKKRRMQTLNVKLTGDPETFRWYAQTSGTSAQTDAFPDRNADDGSIPGNDAAASSEPHGDSQPDPDDVEVSAADAAPEASAADIIRKKGQIAGIIPDDELPS